MKNFLKLLCFMIFGNQIFCSFPIAREIPDPCVHPASKGRRLETYNTSEPFYDASKNLLGYAIKQNDAAKVRSLCASIMNLDFSYPYSYESVGNGCCLRKKTPLTLAVELGNVEIVETLLDHMADPNIREDCMKIPLTLTQNPRIIAALLKAGADKEGFGTYGHSITTKAADNHQAIQLKTLRGEEPIPDILLP